MEWRQSVSKTLLLVLGSVCIVIVGIAMALGWLEESGHGPTWFAVANGCAVVVIFSVATVVYTRRLLHGKAVVIRIDEHGIHDHRLSREPIPWKCIRGVRVVHVSGWRYLKLRMTDADQERYLTELARWSTLLPPHGITIRTVGLKPSFDELLAAVERSRPSLKKRKHSF
ncbi:STM3941 family protein [Nonomuraea africana]|uniref:Fumarate reductase subunit D n=1 Tax=Nonomuraea africana TaxID=46171 RepID=A0ABR9K9Z8_9ACTN|nr:STM3941 family protein [Nonomuraea africana]MBE1558839.1 fumarate reductase subunit D [Nonomuraea africana]